MRELTGRYQDSFLANLHSRGRASILLPRKSGQCTTHWGLQFNRTTATGQQSHVRPVFAISGAPASLRAHHVRYTGGCRVQVVPGHQVGSILEQIPWRDGGGGLAQVLPLLHYTKAVPRGQKQGSPIMEAGEVQSRSCGADGIGGGRGPRDVLREGDGYAALPDKCRQCGPWRHKI